jgi:hypothetical protein
VVPGASPSQPIPAGSYGCFAVSGHRASLGASLSYWNVAPACLRCPPLRTLISGIHEPPELALQGSLVRKASVAYARI